MPTPSESGSCPQKVVVSENTTLPTATPPEPRPEQAAASENTLTPTAASSGSCPEKPIASENTTPSTATPPEPRPEQAAASENTLTPTATPSGSCPEKPIASENTTPPTATPSESCPEKAIVSKTTTATEPPFSFFSSLQKRWISYAASYAAMFSGLSSSIYYPALVPLSRALSTPISLINLTITAYLVVAGVAPAFMGDMADQTGRRPVYLLTFTLYVAANIGLALQSSFPALLVLRMVQSAGSSGTFAAAYGVIADIATPAERGSYVGVLIMFTNTAPSLGPVPGGILAEKLGWRWIFWLLVIMSGAHLVALTLFFPETSRKIVQNGSVQAHGIHRTLFSLITKGPRRSNQPGSAESTGTPSKRKFRIPNPLTSLPILSHKNSLAIIMVGSIYYTVSRVMGASLSAQCIEIYELNYLETGLTYLPTGVGGMISSYCTGKLLDRDYRRIAAKVGRDTSLRAAEDNADFPLERTRLRGAWYLIVISSAATLGYGWALHTRAHLAVPLVMQFITGFTNSSIFTICGTLLTDLNPHKSATAQAAYNLVRCIGAGAGVAALQPIADGIGIGGAFTIYAAFCLTSIPALWLLQTQGMKWRAAQEAK